MLKNEGLLPKVFQPSTLKNEGYGGFSLIELLVVLTLVGLLLAVAYPSYKQHIIKARRAEARASLLELSHRIERYYYENNFSYANATLDKLKFAKQTPDGFYEFSIVDPTKTDYSLEALSLFEDTVCQALKINQQGKKSLTGMGTVQVCWGY